jgi:hypothetical protein
MKLHTRVLAADGRDELDDLVGSNRAHDTDPERRLLEMHILLGYLLGLPGVLKNTLKIGFDHAAEFCEMGEASLTMKKRAAKFILQQLDGT